MNYKKSILLVVLIIMSFCLNSCDPPQFYHSGYTTEIINVELIEYEADETKSSRELCNFDSENSKSIDTLNENDIEAFMTEISELYIIMYYTHPYSPDEKCIKISYSDDTFEIISQNRLVVLYDENGNVIEYVGMIDDIEKFISLVNKYFDNNITI